VKKMVLVRYFAALREQRGLGEEQVETAAATAADLYAQLARAHRLTLPAARMRVAINDEFGSWSTELRDGDQLAFIPPVAGG
jgi:molybdopterin converting factor subunit 1